MAAQWELVTSTLDMMNPNAILPYTKFESSSQKNLNLLQYKESVDGHADERTDRKTDYDRLITTDHPQFPRGAQMNRSVQLNSLKPEHHGCH